MLTNVLALLGKHREASLVHIFVGVNVIIREPLLFLGSGNILTTDIFFEVLFLGLLHLFQKHGFLALSGLHTLL
jgi:hypothetical protein